MKTIGAIVVAATTLLFAAWLCYPVSSRPSKDKRTLGASSAATALSALPKRTDESGASTGPTTRSSTSDADIVSAWRDHRSQLRAKGLSSAQVDAVTESDLGVALENALAESLGLQTGGRAVIVDDELIDDIRSEYEAFDRLGVELLESLGFEHQSSGVAFERLERLFLAVAEAPDGVSLSTDEILMLWELEEDLIEGIRAIPDEDADLGSEEEEHIEFYWARVEAVLGRARTTAMRGNP